MVIVSNSEPLEDEGFEVEHKEKFLYTKLTNTEKVWVKNIYKASLNISE